jgi:hypothetical protein
MLAMHTLFRAHEKGVREVQQLEKRLAAHAAVLGEQRNTLAGVRCALQEAQAEVAALAGPMAAGERGAGQASEEGAATENAGPARSSGGGEGRERRQRRRAATQADSAAEDGRAGGREGGEVGQWSEADVEAALEAIADQEESLEVGWSGRLGAGSVRVRCSVKVSWQEGGDGQAWCCWQEGGDAHAWCC